MWLCFMAWLVAGVLTLSAQTPTAEQMKSDLLGHTMGGRQKCWKFQSLDQIKALTIKDQTEHARQYTCTLALELQATNAPAKYAAEARVEYIRMGTGWKLDHVGLLSLKRIK
jgi:hypothetical protein